MNQLLDKFLEQSFAKKIGILAGIICLAYGLYISFVYSPNADAIANLVDSVQIARNEKLVKEKKAANLVRLERELREMESKLKEAVAQLPDRKEMSELLTNHSNKAREAGLEIVLFRPRNETFQEV